MNFPQHAIQQTVTTSAYMSGTGLFTFAWFAENASAIQGISMMIGAVIVVATFVVNWYYKHKHSIKK